MKQLTLFIVLISFIFSTCNPAVTDGEIGTAATSYKFETTVYYDRGDTTPNTSSLANYESLWQRAGDTISVINKEGGSLTKISINCIVNRSFEYDREVATPASIKMNRQLGDNTVEKISERYDQLLLTYSSESNQSIYQVLIRPSIDIDGDSCYYRHFDFSRAHYEEFGEFPQDSLAQFRKAKITLVVETESRQDPETSIQESSMPIESSNGGRGDWLLWIILLLFVLEIALLIWSFGPRESGKVFAVMLGTAAALTAGAYLLSQVNWSAVGEGIARVIRIVFAVGFVALFVRTLQLFGEWFAQFWPAISDWFARGLIRYPVHFRINRYEMLGIILVGGYLLWNIISDIISVLF